LGSSDRWVFDAGMLCDRNDCRGRSGEVDCEGPIAVTVLAAKDEHGTQGW
jgi:hypothetical protein